MQTDSDIPVSVLVLRLGPAEGAASQQEQRPLSLTPLMALRSGQCLGGDSPLAVGSAHRGSGHPSPPHHQRCPHRDPPKRHSTGLFLLGL